MSTIPAETFRVVVFLKPKGTWVLALNAVSSQVSGLLPGPNEARPLHLCFEAADGVTHQAIGNREYDVYNVHVKRGNLMPSGLMDALKHRQERDGNQQHPCDWIAYASNTVVEKPFRHRGIATALANRAEQWLKAHGVHFVAGRFVAENPRGQEVLQARHKDKQVVFVNNGYDELYYCLEI
jgi:GNAT superfamily N-acetyltransferase